MKGKNDGNINGLQSNATNAEKLFCMYDRHIVFVSVFCIPKLARWFTAKYIK